MTLVDKRYAEALFQIAFKNDQIVEYSKQLSELKNVFTDNSDLWKTLNDPQINMDHKQELVRQIFTNELPVEILNFLLVLLESYRINNFEGILKQYKIMAYKFSNVLNIQIYSAFELDTNQIQAISDKYKSLYHANRVRTSHFIDSSLIGGVIIKVGDMVYDNSVAGRLKALKNNL